MRRDEALAILKAHKDELARFSVKSLALFGSGARDEVVPESDVDLLVEFEGPATYRMYLNLLYFLEKRLRRQVDLVMRGAMTPRAMPYIERDLLRVA